MSKFDVRYIKKKGRGRIFAQSTRWMQFSFATLLYIVIENWGYHNCRISVQKNDRCLGKIVTQKWVFWKLFALITAFVHSLLAAHSEVKTGTSAANTYWLDHAPCLHFKTVLVSESFEALAALSTSVELIELEEGNILYSEHMRSHYKVPKNTTASGQRCVDIFINYYHYFANWFVNYCNQSNHSSSWKCWCCNFLDLWRNFF